MWPTACWYGLLKYWIHVSLGDAHSLFLSAMATACFSWRWPQLVSLGDGCSSFLSAMATARFSWWWLQLVSLGDGYSSFLLAMATARFSRRWLWLISLGDGYSSFPLAMATAHCFLSVMLCMRFLYFVLWEQLRHLTTLTTLIRSNTAILNRWFFFLESGRFIATGCKFDV